MWLPTVAHPSAQGYWWVNDKGEVFGYGAAEYHGGAGAWMKDGKVVAQGTPGAARIVMNGLCTGLASTPSGNGYWLSTQAGSTYTFGDAEYLGDPHP